MWLEQFALYYGHNYTDGNSNGERWYLITKKEEPTKEDIDNEIPF